MPGQNISLNTEDFCVISSNESCKSWSKTGTSNLITFSLYMSI